LIRFLSPELLFSLQRDILLCRFDGLGSGTLEPLQGFLDKQPDDI
jgi:hypothetical protein